MIFSLHRSASANSFDLCEKSILNEPIHYESVRVCSSIAQTKKLHPPANFVGDTGLFGDPIETSKYWSDGEDKRRRDFNFPPDSI